MGETSAVIQTLKQALRSHRLTYADVARGLSMSEANIKRMFASERFSLNRLEDICRLMGMELVDLFQLHDKSRQRISQLSEEAERELVADPQLLLVAVCVRNHLSFAEILEHYHISDTELIQKLARLDRLKIIDLLPQNRIKLRVAENFHWRTRGPIERFYEQAIQKEFLRKGFDDKDNPRIFLSGLLSERSQTLMKQRLLALSEEYTRLHREDRDLPLHKRHNVGILLAMREWEFSALAPFSKDAKSKKP